MQEHFFKERGIYYRINQFRQDRQTLVFVHGVSGSSSAWLKYEQKFENKYNVLTYDLRGHGKSRKPSSYNDYKIEDFTDDLTGLLQYLDINKFVLISHSFAALIALEFLTKHQDEVSEVIFLSPSYHVKERLSAKLIGQLLSLAHLLEIFPHKDVPGKHIDYSTYPNSGDWNIPRMIADVGNTGLKVYLYSSKQALEVNYKRFLDDIKIPTLIIHGKKDTIFPFRSSVVMNQKIKNSELKLLPNADHILVLNYFEEVSKAIKRFLEE
ncbi:MAG: alpha/beta hydrolase [Candidatus Parcubacteria bacterium]|nr:alpha/beta hydrolase [Candidatus Parcubacteria bacterium]